MARGGCVEAADRSGYCGGGDVAGLDDDRHGRALARKGSLDAVEAAHHRDAARERFRARHRGVHPQRRDRQGDQDAPAEQRRQDGPAKHPLDDPRPDPVRFALLRGASATRKPSLLDAVSECGQHRGQHGEGPEHRHRNDEDRPGGKGREGWRAAEVHAGHRDHHRDARYEHRATGRGGRRLNRGPVHATGGALLAHALEVEQRVVDPDGEPDQQDHAIDRLVDRRDVTDRPDEAECRGHARDRQQQRHTGGNERTKREHEDEQRDRQRRRFGLVQVVIERLHDPPGRAGITVLGDHETPMGPGGGVDGLEWPGYGHVGLRLVARKCERHERGMAVGRDRARVDVLCDACVLEALDDVGDGSAERGLVSRGRPALDQHDLLGLARERRARDASGAPSVAHPALLGGQGVRVEDAADKDRRGDEGDPAQDCGLAVLGAPTAGPGGDAATRWSHECS